MLLVSLLTLSAVAYLLARLGHLQRIRSHRRVPRAVIDALFDVTNPTLTAIIPSYKEERRVIRQTLLSAALQEFPNIRVVLLIDDPPNTTDPDAMRQLDEARALPGEIALMLDVPRRRFEHALDTYESTPAGTTVRAEDIGRLASCYDDAAGVLREWGEAEEITDHVDAFLVDEVMLGIAVDLETVAGALRDALASNAEISVARMRRLYRRLVWIFRAELSSFERKRFASLSHEPNKAMNLNSYLGLMGGRYRIRETPSGAIHLPVRGGSFDLEVPDPDYVLTLDADSMLLPEYCLRLVSYMEREENADVAIVQTPYSAFRGAPTRIERISGATTDLQHIVHQGLTYYDATFWVGRERHPAQARARHRHDRGVAQRLRDPPVHQGPHGHRGHRVEHRHAHARLAARELPGAPQLLGDAAGPRRALRPARALGRRRPAGAAPAVRARTAAHRPLAARADR